MRGRTSPETRAAAVAGIILGLTLGAPESSHGVQQRAPTSLRPATVRLSEEFSRVVAVRELSDGRVLVADMADKRLVVADFARNTVTPIGREGQGPGEYNHLSALFPLGADSTLMPDLMNGRWNILTADRIATTLPPDHPAVRASRGALRGANGRGQALIVAPPPIGAGKQQLGAADSNAMSLVNLASGHLDTIAMLRTAPLAILTETDRAGKVTRAGITRPPFSVGEEAHLFLDGWVVVARLDPYRVDWHTPEGRWIRGAPLPFVARPVTARERQAFLARQAAALGRAMPEPAAESWPSTMPPFQPSPFVPVPDGSVLILRTPTADQPGHQYDRIDRRGALLGWLELPANERLAGIGARGAYVVTTDADGIQRLQRHPWP